MSAASHDSQSAYLFSRKHSAGNRSGGPLLVALLARFLVAIDSKLLYAARKKIVEPVFGQIKAARGIRKFLLRGLKKVSGEWQLICLTHNLLKIWRRATHASGAS